MKYRNSFLAHQIWISEILPMKYRNSFLAHQIWISEILPWVRISYITHDYPPGCVASHHDLEFLGAFLCHLRSVARDTSITFKVYSCVNHCKIQINFDLHELLPFMTSVL